MFFSPNLTAYKTQESVSVAIKYGRLLSAEKVDMNLDVMGNDSAASAKAHQTGSDLSAADPVVTQMTKCEKESKQPLRRSISLVNSSRKLVLMPNSKSRSRLTANEGPDTESPGGDNFDRSKYYSFNVKSDPNENPAIRKYFGLTDDLEWDKDHDFSLVAESDSLSTYDLEEQMAELIKQKFMEFEMMSNASMKSMTTNRRNSMISLNFNDSNANRKCSIDDDFECDEQDLQGMSHGQDEPSLSFYDDNDDSSSRLAKAKSKRQRNLTNTSLLSTNSSFTPADCLTMEDLFRIKYMALQQQLLIQTPASILDENFLKHSESFSTNQDMSRFNMSAPIMYAPLTFDVESLYASLIPERVQHQESTQSNNREDDSKLEKHKQDAFGSFNHLNEPSQLSFYHSMPDLRLFSSAAMGSKSPGVEFTSKETSASFKRIQLNSKHLSLLDIRSFEWIYLKNQARKDVLSQKNTRQSLIRNMKLDLKINHSTDTDRLVAKKPKSPAPVPAQEAGKVSDNKNEPATAEVCQNSASSSQSDFNVNRRISLNGSSVNFSRMGRLAMIRSYMTRIGERVKQMVANAFNTNAEPPRGVLCDSKPAKAYLYNVKTNHLYAINEETVDTYDIIEIDDVLHTPSSIGLDQNELTERLRESCSTRLASTNSEKMRESIQEGDA